LKWNRASSIAEAAALRRSSAHRSIFASSFTMLSKPPLLKGCVLLVHPFPHLSQK
jgi:hypothetical protein